VQAQSDEDDLGGEDVAVSMEGSKLDEFFQEVSTFVIIYCMLILSFLLQ
jgi:hypothetical protein